MKITSTFIAADKAQWRSWLEANHASEQEIWLVYYKPSSGHTGIDYESSVQEALCFGWIDSIIQKIDAESYARKFNPRRSDSPWSASNKARMEKLIAENRVTPAGLAKYDPQARESQNEYAQQIRRGELPIPGEIIQSVQENPPTWNYYRSLSPSKQRLYMGWVMSASKQETRQKRLVEVISLLAQGKDLGLK